jgi:hypothetical protein
MRRRLRQIAMVVGVLLAGLLVQAPAAHAAYDSDDPVQSGCSQHAYVANTIDLHKYADPSYPVVAHFQNWYSWSCNTNWAQVWWNSTVGSDTITGINVEIHTRGDIGYPVGVHKQCEPTSCTDIYTGGLSPAWTDMIEGTDVACLTGFASWMGGGYGGGTNVSVQTGSNDNACA